MRLAVPSLATGEGVVVLFNDPGPSGVGPWAEADRGVLMAVDAVCAALGELAVPHRRAGILRLTDIPGALAAGTEKLVFNLVERLDGHPTDFNQVPAVCEALGRSVTGSASESLSLTLDKWLTKARLRAAGLPAPEGLVIDVGARPPRRLPPFPLIVKPAASDGSEGIFADSIVRNRDGLERAVERVHAGCAQPALVERYIEGREFNLAVMQRGEEVLCLPVAEIDFALYPEGRPHIVDYDIKWHPGAIGGRVSPRRVPAPVTPAQRRRLHTLARQVWAACGGRDYMRVDSRMDARGRLYVLEANTNPDLAPCAGFAASLQAAGIPFTAFVAELLANAAARLAPAATSPAVTAATASAPSPYGPVPSARQLAWHDIEFYGFVHFTTNTFTDLEWGYGDERPDVFQPSDFSADQIAATAAMAGMGGLVLTCKHHDGFCLWPSRHTEHSVRSSPWRNGRGNVVAELSAACRAHGLRFGVYLSPWDRNHADYGRPAYVRYYREQLRELLTGYGPLFMVWFDGANGGDGYYGGARESRLIDKRTYYGWQDTWDLVRSLQPNACMFSDAGPDVRWVGNEHGEAGETCWATFSRGGVVPGEADCGRLNRGDRPGSDWVPAECDVSIRPGWFYHAHEDAAVKSPADLFRLYLTSVGRGASLHLNLPPDRRGRIADPDVAALRGFRARMDAAFARDLARAAVAAQGPARGGLDRFAPARLIDGQRDTYWATDDHDRQPEAVLSFAESVTFNLVDVREFLRLGQRVEALAVDAWADGGWKEIGHATSIGARRLIPVPLTRTDRVRLRIAQAAACPAIRSFSLWHDAAACGSASAATL